MMRASPCLGSTTKSGWRGLWPLAALMLFACSETKTITAPTQVTLRIYNNDAALIEQMSTLQIGFALREGETFRAYPNKSFASSALVWPVDIPIIPGRRADEQKQFEVIVRALADAEPLAEARSVAGFVSGARRLLELWLYRCPGHDEAFVCAEPGCHGESCPTCLPDGECQVTGITDPNGLEPFEVGKTPGDKPTPTTIVTDPVETMDGGLASEDDAEIGASECSLPCGAHSRCLIKEGNPSCVCLAGFAAAADGNCLDIDECARPDRGGCSLNADCKNNEGARSCVCREGFTDAKGDGSECTNRCSLAGCDANATCAIVGSEAKCQCTGAYTGDGKSCTFNPSCAALNCGASSVCGLSAGSSTSYECKCLTGYERDSASPAFVCKDSDECKQMPSVCAATPSSTCENNPGGFTCPCRSGFRKSQADRCEDIPDCPASACSGGACLEGTNDYSCNCAAGYTPASDGKSCVDARNDCPASACAPGGTCLDGLNAYSCMCGAGYTLSTDKHSCTDNNECVPNPCKNGGVCSDRVNDFACDCTGTGFVGKDCGTRSTGCSMVGTPCSVGRGECLRSGLYVCNAQGTALQCGVSAGASSAELCDGKDNNCDGAVDEPFTTLRTACSSGMGACQAQGIYVCNPTGSGVVCNALTGTPAANDAVCNNRDDDCNGQVDEDYVAHGTSCGTGACANTGVSSCVSGAERPNCVPGASSSEICDGRDNNCDGMTDEGIADRCLDTKQLQRCMGGALRVEQCDLRTPIAMTCVVNACMGMCAAGSRQCNATGALQTCGTAGDWGEGVPCLAGFLCDRSLRTCRENAPRALGRDAATNGFQHPFDHAYMAATPVLANEDLRVLQMGVLSHTSATGGLVDMAIYGDTFVNNKHRPGMLLSLATVSRELAVPNRITYLAPQDTALNLVANRLYWVAIKTNVATGENLVVYEYQDRAAQANGQGTFYQTGLNSWLDPFPMMFPSNVPPQDGIELSLFLQVQRYWH